MTAESTDKETTKKRDYSSGWWAERNARRNEKYKKDSKYRKEVNRRNRLSQRRNGLVRNDASKFSGHLNLDKLERLGSTRGISMPNGNTEDRLSFTTAQLTSVLGSFSMPVLYGWQKKGILPKPCYEVAVTNATNSVCVYLEKEVINIIECLNVHYNVNSYAYLRQDHKETIELLKASVEYARKQINAGV